MALVKKSKIALSTATSAAVPQTPPQSRARATPPAGPNGRQKSGQRRAKQHTASERIAAATEELAGGLTEAAAATKELARAMEQISTGAEEAAGASQEQSAAIKRIVANLGSARGDAETAGRRSEVVTAALTDASAQIAASVRAVERNAERQLASVGVIAELERRANDIAEITGAVSQIADQTNLLALNAAIEAARAGEHGRGFAVVADEVRTLAEVADKNALEVQRLADSIKSDVQEVVDALKKASETAAGDARSAARIATELDAKRDEMAAIAKDSRDILSASVEAERAAVEAGRGAEQVAAAAEEQASGATQAQSAVAQQAKSLNEAQRASQALAQLAEALRGGKGGTRAVDQIGASAEELSATIQELSSTAAEVMAAVEQINRACQLQASATQQTSAALTQIESSARLAQQNGKAADDRVRNIEAALKEGRGGIENLVQGVFDALKKTQHSVATVGRVDAIGRKIEKMVDGIALINVQTSMLAVSGAVEAARAGDSGRGFAIVSNNIRSLAHEAASNVERAKDTVRGVLEQIAALKADLEQIIASSETEVQNNRSVSAVLEKVGTEVASMRVASQSIVSGAAEILAAVIETAAASRQIATSAEEASAASRQSAMAATEQSQSAEDLAAAIEEIASLAEELKLENA